MDSPPEELAIFTELPAAVSITKVPLAFAFLIKASCDAETYFISRADDPTVRGTSSSTSSLPEKVPTPETEILVKLVSPLRLVAPVTVRSFKFVGPTTVNATPTFTLLTSKPAACKF